MSSTNIIRFYVHPFLNRLRPPYLLFYAVQGSLVYASPHSTPHIPPRYRVRGMSGDAAALHASTLSGPCAVRMNLGVSSRVKCNP